MPEEAEHGESLIHVAIKGEVLFHIGPIPVTNSMIGTLIATVDGKGRIVHLKVETQRTMRGSAPHLRAGTGP